MKTVNEDGLRTMLAERSGLDRDSLWYPVYAVPRDFGLTWPLTAKQADDVLKELLHGLRRQRRRYELDSPPGYLLLVIRPPGTRATTVVSRTRG
ncbi:hypothetical protein AB0G86_19130 [Streptomyces scabiei]|uniref:hypothetical protein n=1 Tax=Streptomyces scabiei TaxID=1930 RepID=UPI0033C5EDF8